MRLPGYDYSQPGAYFLTVCTQNRQCLFGEIENTQMRLSDAGQMVQVVWKELTLRYPGVETDAFVIMPNHVHGIIWMTSERRGEVLSPRNDPDNNNLDADVDETSNQGGETPPLQRSKLGQIIAYFKYQSTKEMNRIETKNAITKFWQRNYYEHIIRDGKDLQNKTDYIEANPMLWDEDDNNPRNNPSA